MGMPQDDIARVIGIGTTTLKIHYREELDRGAPRANAEVAKRLFRLATQGEGSSAVRACTFWLRARAGWSIATDARILDAEQLDHIVDSVTRIIEEEIAAEDRGMADRVVGRLREIRMPDRRGGLGGRTPEEMAATLRDAARAIDEGVVVAPPEDEGGEA
jgi:hypothetical protein